jgi:NTE family protein
MTPQDFTRPVADLVAAGKAAAAARPVSDIVDPAGNQYVDLVMGGGGVLGIALCGYTYLLEEAGIRFLRIGGTSAGSINALALAALGTPGEKKSGPLIAELAGLDIWKLVDGPSSARALVRDFLHDRSAVEKAFDVARALPAFNRTLGLNPGTYFRDWLTGVLGRAGVTTAGQLRERMRSVPPGLRFRGGKELSVEEADPHLGLVATDLTTETKAVFPLMAPCYWADPDGLDPAEFVRASMSIPYFFEPYRVAGVPQGDGARATWDRVVKTDRYPPVECVFVDGGVLSNFPIDLFHDPLSVPTAPTFGVKLGADDQPAPPFAGPVHFTVGLFNAARHALDNDFIARNPDFRQLVSTVDTGTQSWLNFDLKPDEKVALFREGAQAAVEFLRTFHWERYKETRAGMAHAHKVAPPPTAAERAGPVGAG